MPNGQRVDASPKFVGERTLVELSGSRTADLVIANDALSQLSYSPEPGRAAYKRRLGQCNHDSRGRLRTAGRLFAGVETEVEKAGHRAPFSHRPGRRHPGDGAAADAGVRSGR